MNAPNQEVLDELRRLFFYNFRTGKLTSRSTGKPITKSNGKYLQVRAFGKTFVAQKVVWFLVKGEWPEFEIDHRDGIKSNNRFGNLRPASRGQNMQNLKRARRGSASGHLGVYMHRGRFRAEICVNGVRTYLGVHDTAKAAHNAYIDAKRRMHPYGTL